MNILVLTKVYPASDLSQEETPVVHYFVKEWIKMGLNVKVIVNYPIFPKIVSWGIRRFEKCVATLMGSIPPRYCKALHYEHEGVDVYRFPMLKYIPHGSYSDLAIRKQEQLIIETLDDCHFVPDVIVAHWWHPHLELLPRFKALYNCKTCMVVHDIGLRNGNKKYINCFSQIDVWGMRSLPLKNAFERIVGSGHKIFHCTSGIPEKYIVGNSKRNFDTQVLSVCFVGGLIKRKNPVAILDAIIDNQLSFISEVVYIGNGAERKKLEKKANMYFKDGCVKCLGRLSRDGVSQRLKNADIFVMISKAEAFGLVYLEAMGAGCITIASRNEGMDGIIIDGVNGYLCNAGDSTELANILKRIQKLSPAERKKISNAAVETARENTDYLAAKKYLDAVVGA